MNKEINVLKPVELKNTIFSATTLENLKNTAGLIAKRVGGGPVQVGRMSFKDMAEIMISSASGFDSKNRKNWENKEDALRRIFEEFGYPVFKDAIVLAVVEKYAVDPTGFIPLAPRSIDIEAAYAPGKELHREIEISGIPKPIDETFINAISQKIGITTEYGNKGDSMEFVAFINTPGVWTHIKDIEVVKDQSLNRKTGMIIVTQYLTLYCVCAPDGQININGLQSAPEKLLSVKTQEAIKVMKAVYKELNMS